MATRNSLLRAEEKRVESVVFPAIGTGVGGLSTHVCARAMLEESKEWSAKRAESLSFRLEGALQEAEEDTTEG